MGYLLANEDFDLDLPAPDSEVEVLGQAARERERPLR